ncbi:WD40-repeat-containing domain protein [Bisporella sp. PMI_857]|nr:WD40-repeat-containing domain protein [Bisporella sp. PMI_857]
MSSFNSRLTPTGPRSATIDTSADLEKDVMLSSLPEDSIFSLSFSPVADHLAVSAWDKKVRIYDIKPNLGGVGVASIDFDGPVLSCDWAETGAKFAGAGADMTAKVIDLGAQGYPSQTVAVHDAPIKAVKFVKVSEMASQLIVTGSWDRTIRYWDMRTANPVAIIALPERVYAMDVRDKLMVAALADKRVAVINLDDPGRVHKTIERFCLGSIEARVSTQNIDKNYQRLNFSFKCHRDQVSAGTRGKEVKCWSVNAISTNSRTGTFSTAGSDGTPSFWDYEAKTRLKSYPSVGGPISATAYNFNASTFAYAVSYD